MKPLRRTSGFTVLEMLVAAGVTALLAGVMLTVVVNTLNGWSRSQSLLSAESQARLALDQLAYDLESAVNRPDGATWLAITWQDDSGASNSWAAAANPKPSSLDPTATRASLGGSGQLTDAHFGAAGGWLRLIAGSATTTTSATEPNAPVAASYQIIRRRVSTSADAETHYMFFRSEVKPSDTFAGGYDLASATLPYLSTLRNPALTQMLADNVIDFGVWFYRRAADGTLTRIFPTDNTTLSAGYPAAGVFPDVADVMIRVLTTDGAQKIRTLEGGTTTGDWWTIAEQNSKVFTRRVTLRPRQF